MFTFSDPDDEGSAKVYFLGTPTDTSGGLGLELESPPELETLSRERSPRRPRESRSHSQSVEPRSHTLGIERPDRLSQSILNKIKLLRWVQQSELITILF